MLPRRIQTFEVSLKAFIVHDDGRALLLRESDTGYWELPGGRIDVGEERLAHADILAREMREELGAAFELSVGDKAISWVRQRPTDGVFQFLLARVCRHEGGELRLSDEHGAFAWLGNDEWRQREFPPESDYLDGLERLFALLGKL